LQTQARTTRSSAARAADEALEDPLLVFRRNAGTAVPNREAGLAGRRDGRAEGDLVTFLRVLDRVLGELYDRLRQPLPVGDDDASADGVQVPLAAPDGARLRLQLVGQLRHVDEVELQEVRLVRLGQQQQVVDDPAHAIELVQHDFDRALPLVGILVGELQMPAHDRDRRA
jgi:hypothetical protein